MEPCLGIAKNKTTQHKNYTSQKYNKKMLNTSEEHKIKFKPSTMSEIYKASIRSTIGKPQVLCVTQGQRQNNPSKLEY